MLSISVKAIIDIAWHEECFLEVKVVLYFLHKYDSTWLDSAMLVQDMPPARDQKTPLWGVVPEIRIKGLDLCGESLIAPGILTRVAVLPTFFAWYFMIRNENPST